jgi:OmpA-OmpF porin, OOP family
MRRLLLAFPLFLAVAAAHADGTGVYIGAGVADARLDQIRTPGRNFDLDNAGWKIYAGFRPISPIAIEATYLDLGSQTRHFDFGSQEQADAKAFAAYAVGFLPLPLPLLDVFGKAGVARWQLDGRTSPSFFAIDDRGTDFAWGGGAQMHFGNFGLRLEYEQFQVRNTDGVKLVTLSASFGIL